MNSTYIHRLEEHNKTPYYDILIVETSGKKRPFKGSVEELLQQHPKFKGAKTILNASALGIQLLIHE
jgi:hypothetical protein